jgi:hypothetical protein
MEKSKTAHRTVPCFRPKAGQCWPGPTAISDRLARTDRRGGERVCDHRVQRTRGGAAAAGSPATGP